MHGVLVEWLSFVCQASVKLPLPTRDKVRWASERRRDGKEPQPYALVETSHQPKQWEQPAVSPELRSVGQCFPYHKSTGSLILAGSVSLQESRILPRHIRQLDERWQDERNQQGVGADGQRNTRDSQSDGPEGIRMGPEFPRFLWARCDQYREGRPEWMVEFCTIVRVILRLIFAGNLKCWPHNDDILLALTRPQYFYAERKGEEAYVEESACRWQMRSRRDHAVFRPPMKNLCYPAYVTVSCGKCLGLMVITANSIRRCPCGRTAMLYLG